MSKKYLFLIVPVLVAIVSIGIYFMFFVDQEPEDPYQYYVEFLDMGFKGGETKEYIIDNLKLKEENINETYIILEEYNYIEDIPFLVVLEFESDRLVSVVQESILGQTEKNSMPLLFQSVLSKVSGYYFIDSVIYDWEDNDPLRYDTKAWSDSILDYRLSLNAWLVQHGSGNKLSVTASGVSEYNYLMEYRGVLESGNLYIHLNFN